jgi:hypothetical protein
LFDIRASSQDAELAARTAAENHERDAAAKLANLYARDAAVAERERQLDARVAAIRAKATDDFRARDDSACRHADRR